MAKWYYKDHLNRKQIAAKLKLSNPDDQRPINAALAEIVRSKIVRIDIPETILECGPANDLKERFQHLQEIITVPWYNREDYADLLRRWGVAAAIYFESLVQQKGTHHVGITGGESLFEFCEAVIQEERPNVHVYTTCLVGRGPLPAKASHVDPLVNATLLWAKCGRIRGHCHYATVPPYRTLTRAAIRAELDDLAKRKSIREAIEEMDQINIVFAGLGPVKPDLPGDDPEQLHSKITMTALLEPIVTPDQLQDEGAIAEISNSFFRKDGKGDDEKWRFFLSAGHYDERRRGVEFFRRMVEDGKKVIVIAGPHKIEAIKVALKAKLFNVWITDYQTLCSVAGPSVAKI